MNLYKLVKPKAGAMPSPGSIPARTRIRADAAVRSRNLALAGRIPDRIRHCICRTFEKS